MDYEQILTEIRAEVSGEEYGGKVADYIPELKKVSSDKFGMHLCCKDGSSFGFGDALEPFSIQSISKVFSLSMAFLVKGDTVWNRVDVEPSGNPFNSLVQLEYEQGIPRNPLINAGALVISDMLVSHYEDPKKAFLSFVRKLSANPKLEYNEKVAASESDFGHRNSALANLMKSFGNMDNDIESVLDFYFHTCALEMNCQDLARAFQVFANDGVLPATGEVILSRSYTKRINAIMQTCGFYDEAGEFSFRVGLPGKSGVGGGIAAVHPDQYSVAVWSPKLNEKGNSAKGMAALEMLTTKTGQSVF